MKYAEAVREAIGDALAADERVILIGEEVGALGGVFTTTQGLLERFGPDRVLDAPIAENGFVGFAIGAATEGLRPIVEIMFSDFVTLAMDQIVNLGAKLRYMSGGQFAVPLVLRMAGGAGTHHGPQHSQSLETWFAHVPGLVVAMPSTSSDAYWMLRRAVDLDDPVVFIESKYLYFRQSDPVDVSSEPVEGLGAKIVRSGDDITVVSAGRMVHRSVEAAEHLQRDHGVSCEVVDLRWLWPMDTQTVGDSVGRTNRLAVIHEAIQFCGWGGEVAAWVAENRFYDLDAPIARVGGERVPIAFNQLLEEAAVPTTELIERRLLDLMQA
jgi:pyruvate dehydrogenase E1 component beta subunit